MSTVCPCKGCENRSIYCHSECVEYTRWRDNLDQLKKKDKQLQLQDLKHEYLFSLDLKQN